MKTVKYDTSKTGWETILRDYKANLLEKFIQEWSPDGLPFEMNSGEAFRYESEQLKKQDKTISRTSIIFGLNAMVDMGLLTFREKTGKGGHHKIYRLAMTPRELELYVTTILVQGIKATWPQAYSEVAKRVLVGEPLEGIDDIEKEPR